ncbi:restriction endonuclease subunit S [Limosilactobacillus reuteri]|uniref:restriction endonuclease subunit S n=1 Tax=Limosilactobacillus reuteri TaxID=1598 RepID=UPI002B1CC5C6|nr:restriction endonuclease subunit S [Limosilactobacillus reuteri]
MFFSVLSIIFIKVRINVKWEQRKLGEVILDYKRKNNNDRLPVLTSSFQGIEYQEKHFGSQQKHDTSDYNVLPKEYMTYRNRSDNGYFRFNINNLGVTGIVSKFYPVFTTINTNKLFLASYINHNHRLKNHFKVVSVGTSQHVLSLRNFKKTNLLFPSKDEQDQIGKFFNLLNRAITLQQRKLEQLKLLEKAHQQKLFPNSFQEKPLLRILHGDNSWWNSYIGEVFTERVDKGSSEKLLSVSITDGVYPFDESKRKNNSSDDKHNYKKVFQNDIAYNSMRLWQGALGVSKYEGIVSPAYTVLKPLPNQNSIFYEFMFKNIDMLHIFQRNSQGLTSDTWNLKFNQLQHIKIKTTNLNSQNKIAKLLIKIEELKNNESNYYHNLMTLKKYLLQKLFI